MLRRRHVGPTRLSGLVVVVGEDDVVLHRRGPAPQHEPRVVAALPGRARALRRGEEAREGGQEVHVRDQRARAARPREQLGVRVDERHAEGLLVEVEVLLPKASVGQPHLAVIGGADDEGVVVERRAGRRGHRVERGEDVDEVVVRRPHEVAVEVEVVPLLLGRASLPLRLKILRKASCARGLQPEVLVHGGREADARPPATRCCTPRPRTFRG